MLTKFKNEHKNDPFVKHTNLTSEQLVTMDLSQVHKIYHNLVIEQTRANAASKIQKFFRTFKVRMAYKHFVKQTVKIQRFVRRRFIAANVFDVVERNRQAPVI